MTKDQYNELMKQGEIAAHAKPEPAAPLATSAPNLAYSFDDFLPLLVELLRPKQHLTAAPTFTPRNFLESIQLYDSGGVRRLYVFVNGAWRYSTLT